MLISVQYVYCAELLQLRMRHDPTLKTRGRCVKSWIHKINVARDRHLNIDLWDLYYVIVIVQL